MSKKTMWTGIIGLAIVIGLFVANMYLPGPKDAFATCIAESGAKFYGAFWCPHCKEQKTLFGKSATLLPYIECSTPDGKGVLSICTEAGVEGYPTWVFKDSSVLSGVVTLETLAEKTSCTM